MSGGVLKIAIADASKLGLMKNLKTMTKMEPELFAASISDINEFIGRLSKQDTQKISDKNVKVEKVEKNKDELIEVGSEVIVFGNKLITEAINLGSK
jgi:type IV pilus assembly protein PilB